MKILKDSRQYFEVPAVKTLPIGSWRGNGHLAKSRKAGPKGKKAPKEKGSMRSAAREMGAAIAILELNDTAMEPANDSAMEPVNDRAMEPVNEFEAALEAALDSRGPSGRNAFTMTGEEIARALAIVFPEELCTMPEERPSAAQQSPEGNVFEISYEQEMNCLKQNGLIDRHWVPSGMLRSSDRRETR